MSFPSDMEDENDDLVIVSALLALNVAQYQPPSEGNLESPPENPTPLNRTTGPTSRRLGRQMAPIFIEGLPMTVMAEINDIVTLQCSIKCQTSSWTTWEKDGIAMSPSARIVMRERDKSRRILQIRHADMHDIGSYKIRVENEFGCVESSTRLEVVRSGSSAVLTMQMPGERIRMRRRRKTRPRAGVLQPLDPSSILPPRRSHYDDSTDDSDDL